MPSQVEARTNRIIRRAYRKRLLPMIEQCLLGLARPVASHHQRLSLDRQTAAELLACFDGQTWLADYTIDELFVLWDQVINGSREEKVSIGNFTEYLYAEQIADDLNQVETNSDPAINQQLLLDRRLALCATLYVAGFLPEFNDLIKLR